MGCGSSSLKGESPSADLNTPAQPVTRVKSNFADVDFNADATRRKSTKGADRAPDEVDEERPQSSHQPSQSVPEQGVPVPAEAQPGPEGVTGESGAGGGDDLAEEEMARTNKAEAEHEATKLEPYKSVADEGADAGALGGGGGVDGLGGGEKVPDMVR